MNQSYWSQVLNGRLSRRRALTATAGTAMGAALLTACAEAPAQHAARLKVEQAVS